MLKITALITGRANNSLKDKNLRPVSGRPLLAYPALAAKHCNLINSFFASSDDQKILDSASIYGYNPIMRPAKLALPCSEHIDTIIHALSVINQQGIKPDILVVLLANSATIKSEWITQSIQNLVGNPELTASVPVTQNQDHHPFRAKRLDAKGNLEPFFDFQDQAVSSNRQDLCKNFFLCHNFWTLNLRNGFPLTGAPPWSFMGDKVRPIIVENCFDVHDIEDIAKSEKWLRDENITYQER